MQKQDLEMLKVRKKAKFDLKGMLWPILCIDIDTHSDMK